MPQPRIYQDNAQRQAAFRNRRKGDPQASQAELATLARSLHAVIQTAALYQDFALPRELASARPEQTMRNLIRFFDPIYDPIRNPNGKHGRPDWEENEAHQGGDKHSR